MKYIPRPEILTSIMANQHGAIEASAGTGKTWTLERLFVDLLIQKEARIDDLLVVTFTEKATREMRQRVRATLSSIVFGRGEFAPVSEPPEDPTHFWCIDEETQNRLRADLIAFDRAPIMTIHGFCQRVAQDFAFRSGRAFDFEVVDGRAAFERAFYEELRRQLSQDSFISSLLSSTIFELGTARLARVLYEWCHPNATVYPVWDATRFFEAAESPHWEMIGLEEAIEASPLRRDVGARVLQLCHELRDIAKAIGDEEDVSHSLVLLQKFRMRPVTKRERAGTWLPGMLAKIEASSFRQAALELIYAPQPLGVLVQTFLPLLQARMIRDKERRAQVDFDDMLRVVKDALDGPYGDSLCEALRNTYRFALVDEFQDTDPLQWGIFQRLFVEGTSDHRLFVIGDPKQAIYGFRGADVTTYLQARNSLSDAPVHLSTCYRSRPALITAFNTIFETGFFKGAVRYENPVHAPEETEETSSEEGTCVLMTGPPAADGSEKGFSADVVRRSIFESVADEITSLLEGTVDGFSQKISAQDIQVLVRTADEADLVSEVLRRRGVTTIVYHREGLFDGEPARDVLDLLRAIASPDDRSARLAAFLTPFFGMRLEQLKDAAHLGVEHPWYRLLHHLHGLAERRNYTELWQRILAETRTVTSELLRSDSERRLTDYVHLLDLAAEGALSLDFDELVMRFEKRVTGNTLADAEVQRAENKREAVQVMTMHKAKGLEAEVVFVAGGFSRGRSDLYSPNVCHGHDEHGVAERQAWLRPVPDEVAEAILLERRSEDERLLYVALTRAISRLYIPYFSVESKFKLRGPLHVLNERLVELESQGKLDLRPFSRLQCALPRKSFAEANPDACLRIAASLSEFAPSERASHFQALKQKRAGYLLTSYSRLAAGKVLGDVEEQERSHEGSSSLTIPVDPTSVAEETSSALKRAASLPGGASVGIFLHEVIENVDWAAIRDAESAQAWFEMPKVQQEFERTARRNAVVGDDFAEWSEVLFRALTSAQSVVGLELPNGFCDLTEVFAEMPFMFSIPEGVHPSLSRDDVAANPRERPFEIHRGVFRGVIDLVFRKDGKWFFLDWKSDRLAPENHGLLSDSEMQHHVEEHYGLQAKLYTLAVVRMLDIRTRDDYEARFGGLAYCFLRGMQGDYRGVYSERPSFEDVVSWEAELASSHQPFGYVLDPRRGVDHV